MGRMAYHGATKVSPYHLVYGHEVVLPWELKLDSRRVTFQNQLTADKYSALMKDELEDLAGHRLKALINVEANKARVSRWYDKKVKAKTFEQGELVWKLILPIGTKCSKFRQMVANVGRTIRSKQMRSWQCLYFRDT